MNPELAALETVNVSTVPTPDEVWAPVSSYHVDGLHPVVSRRLLQSMDAVKRDHAPAAAVVIGERGSGKTHLLGWARQQIQARDGYFFYIKVLTGRDFWESATNSMVDSLFRKDAGGEDQLVRLVEDLSRRSGLDPETLAAVTGRAKLTRSHVDSFVRGIRGLDRQVGNEAGDTARALVLLSSLDEEAEIGKRYLEQYDGDSYERKRWGLSQAVRTSQLSLRDLTRLFALSGPLVFAFDQLDNLLAASTTSVDSAQSDESLIVRRLSSKIGLGLMELREEARRTFMIVACLQNTWDRISRSAPRSALDRFQALPSLGAVPDQVTAEAIVASRFRDGYKSVNFVPTYPTWPITESALAEAPHRYTARRLLNRVNVHISDCLGTNAVTELRSLAVDNPVIPDRAPSAHKGDLDGLSQLFGKLRDEVDDVGPLDKAAEDRLMPAMLGAGLQSLVKEIGGDPARFVIETDFGGKRALHARLRYIVDEATEEEIHWSFRAIAADNPRSAQTKMRDAVVEAGLEAGLSSRRLILLRNTLFPRGPKADVIKNDFIARGGQALPIGAADLRTFGALHALLAGRGAGLDVWLRQACPASGSEILATVLNDLRQYLHEPTATAIPAADDLETPATPEITIGRTTRGGRPFAVDIEQLRKHTVVVGAAGSGKTVLVKDIIEQCAAQGVSAIVLDPNDDLGRLGDRWPIPPDGWTDAREQAAQRYFRTTEVLVWTPGLSRGRPLSFHPLPDFEAVLGDEDDFRNLLDSTVAALAPQARIQGRSARAGQQVGVLRRALERYAREGGRTLAGLVELLAEPPSDIVNSRTSRFAVQMADTLELAMESDPLFGESGAPANPEVLLTPSPGKSARISVISFIGLPGDSQAIFVSRLQAALFSWFRAHPTRDRPLGGLLVMDEAQNFVPSGSSNASTESTITLIRQIRKYGLGVVLASQAPKGIHHQALGNTANQFIGRLTAPVQISAAAAMAQSRNAVLDNLGGLKKGTFYAAGEGTGFSKIEVPICLSHHAQPLQEEEIVERSRREN